MVLLRRWTLSQAAAATGLLSAQLAIAQQPDAGSLLRQQQIQEQRPRVPLQIPAIRPAPEEKDRAGDDNGIEVPVSGVTIGGEPAAFSTATLAALVDDAIGRTLTLAGLRDLAARITRHYHDHGYFLSRAYLPPQDVTSGVITITVQEIGLDPADSGVEILGDTLRLKRDVARRIVLEAVPADGPMRDADLERALLLLNRLPGLNAWVNLEPGSRPDTTRLLMGLDEGRLINGNLSYDNSASRYYGTHRAIVGASFNDPGGVGDQFWVSANASNRDNTYVALGYNRPIGYRGLQLNAAYNHLEYRLGQELEALDADGHSDSFSLGVTYPLKLTRLESLWFNGGLDHKALVDNANGTTISDKTVQSVSLGIDWQRFHGQGLSQGGAELRAGELDIDPATPALAADQGVNGPGKNGRYSVLRFNLSRLQKVSDTLSLHIGLDGQLAGANLDSSVRLQYGGPQGVRAYPTGDGSGDEGAKLTLEGRYSLGKGTALGDIQVSLFYDSAWLTQYDNPDRLNDPTLNNHYRISGWGLGLTAARPGKVYLGLAWAQKIGKNPLRSPLTGKDADGTSDENRLWATASFYF